MSENELQARVVALETRLADAEGRIAQLERAVHELDEHKKDKLSLGRLADAAAPYAPRAHAGAPPPLPPRDS